MVFIQFGSEGLKHGGVGVSRHISNGLVVHHLLLSLMVSLNTHVSVPVLVLILGYNYFRHFEVRRQVDGSVS